MFHDQTASKAPQCGLGLEKLGLVSAVAPKSSEQGCSPTLSLLTKPHAGMPRPKVDPARGLGLHHRVASRAVEGGSDAPPPHWSPAESDPKPEAQSPDVTSEEPSPAGMDSPPGSPGRVDYDRQLLRMIDVWPSLSVGVRNAIIAMAEASLER